MGVGQLIEIEAQLPPELRPFAFALHLARALRSRGADPAPTGGASGLLQDVCDFVGEQLAAACCIEGRRGFIEEDVAARRERNCGFAARRSARSGIAMNAYFTEI